MNESARGLMGILEDMPSAKARDILSILMMSSNPMEEVRNNEVLWDIVDSESACPSESFHVDEDDFGKTNHPARYLGKSGIESIDVIAYITSGLSGVDAFCLGNAVKYLTRLGKKTPNVREEWKKVSWYLRRVRDGNHN